MEPLKVSFSLPTYEAIMPMIRTNPGVQDIISAMGVEQQIFEETYVEVMKQKYLLLFIYFFHLIVK